jgi:hypothetical protein
VPMIDRTSAGIQMVLPGCEQRTLPKSATRSDETGQGLLQFFKPPTLKEKLDVLASAPLKAKRVKARKAV